MNKTFVKRHLKERYCFCLKEFPGWNEILNITTAPIVQKVRLRLWIMQGLLISHIKLCNSDTVFDHLVAVWTHTHTQCHQFKVHSCSSSFTGMAGYYGIKKIWSFMEKKDNIDIYRLFKLFRLKGKLYCELHVCLPEHVSHRKAN